MEKEEEDEEQEWHWEEIPFSIRTTICNSYTNDPCVDKWLLGSSSSSSAVTEEGYRTISNLPFRCLTKEENMEKNS